jgi:hypothetical protein
MGRTEVLEHTRVAWWAGAEAEDPLAALTGLVLRAEIGSRCPGLSPLLLYGTPASWSDPGFTGELAVLHRAGGLGSQFAQDIDVLVASGSPGSDGAELARLLAEAGTPTVAVAPEEAWGFEPHRSVGSPFAVPEPALLAPRHFSPALLEARRAYLRVVEGLPERYVLVERSIAPAEGSHLPADLESALARLAEGAGADGRQAEVVWLSPGRVGDDPKAEVAIRERRAETEEGRYQPEDWPGHPWRPQPELRVTNPVDVAAAVAGAGAVVAHSGAMMALAWALGVPHVALAPEESPPSSFAAWTGDASALAADPAQIVATIPNIFARTGRPPGFKRLEATLDQSLDESAEILKKTAADASASPTNGRDIGAGPAGASLEGRLQELQAVNEALRQRLAAERLRFGERAALLEKAANTSVESAIKAVHGQDLIVRRRLEVAEKELRRLQEETAVQQAELRAIHGTTTMRILGPARGAYERMRKAPR